MKPRTLTAAALFACLTAGYANAGVLQWDANGVTAGISDAPGTWNNSNSNWWDGLANSLWVQNSDAQFGTGTLGSAGSVSISGFTPTVNSITFNNDFGAGNFTITGGTVNLLNASTDITANAGDHSINSALSGVGSGLNKKGTAQVRLGGAISYTGATTISDGTLRVNSGANTLYTSTSEFFMSGGSLIVVAGASQNIAKNFTFSSASGSIYTFDNIPAAANHQLSGLMTVDSGANFNIRARNAGAFVNFDVTGQITGAGNFIVSNAAADGIDAAVRISSTLNNYGGTTTISGGRLVLGNSEVIPNGSTVTMNLVGTDRRATLDLNGKSETIAGLSSTSNTSLIFNNSGAGTSVLTVGSSNATASFAGIIQNDGGTVGGTVALTKIGTGTQTLTSLSLNTYTGDTTVSGGILDVDGSLANNGANKVFIAKDANDDFTGSPELQRAFAASTSLAGIGATEVGGLGTVASLIAGSTTSATSIDMAFRGRNNAIVAGETSLLSSDVLKLEGLDGVVFVLQMSYDPAAALANSQAETTLKLGYLNTNTNSWMNAIDGNHGTNTGSFFLGSYLDAGNPTALGSYGVDIVNNVVWAVLDHNSFFAVIPTPGALPAGLMLMGLVAATKRRHKA
jgi:autotransporter-associated beta strand protein